MTKQPEIAEAVVNISSSVDTVWRLVTNSKVIARATEQNVRAEITEKDGRGNGILSIGNGVFFAKYAPYDLELNNKDAKIKLRVTKQPIGCRVIIAGAVSTDSSISVNSAMLQQTLDRFKSIVSEYIHPDDELYSGPEEEHARILPRDDISADAFGAGYDPRSTVFTAEPESGLDAAGAPAYAEAGESRDKKNRVFRKRRVIVAVVLLLVAVGVFFLARGILRSVTGLDTATDRSDGVNLSGAMQLEAGMQKNRIAFLLGTNGITLDDGQVVYRSKSALRDGRPKEQIAVTYDGNRLVSVTYLDLESATKAYNIGAFPAQIESGMTQQEVVDAAGLPMSMWRRYPSADGETIEEVHFGYLDPTANFNPAWRGEFAVLLNRTAGTVGIENWGPYDGSDPSMTGDIAGTPYANQYGSYTDFLNDRYQFNRSLLLLNGYSLGDTKFFFGGEPQHYSDDFGYSFYSVDSAETLDDGETPLYRIAIGYDHKGAFRMASFSNMRLYHMPQTLVDSDYRSITRGMSYNEVRQIMHILPTAVYIESNDISFCYGRFLSTDVADEQFEIIVRFDIETNIANKVLINTAVSDVMS